MKKSELGRLLKKRREELGIPQYELARRLGVTQSYISRIEGGNENISLDVFSWLARELGLEPVFQLEEDGKVVFRDLIRKEKR